VKNDIWHLLDYVGGNFIQTIWMKFLSILFLFLWVLKFCLAIFGYYYFLEGSVWMSNYASLLLYIFQVVQWLLDSEPLKILSMDMIWDLGLLYGKRKNLGGDTAFDILERQTLVVDNQRIRYMLRQNRFVRRLVYYLIFPNQFFMMWVVEIGRQQTSITDERRNALLVVAVLLVTVTYQAALHQPHQYSATRSGSETQSVQLHSPPDQRYRCQSLQLHSRPVQR
jgi:hypothetical protein